MSARTAFWTGVKLGSWGEFAAERAWANRKRIVKRAKKMWPLRSALRRRPARPLYRKYSPRRRLSVKRKRSAYGARKRARVIGYPKGASTAQNNQLARDLGAIPLESKRIYSIELTRIGRSSQGETDRRSLAMYISGFKICMCLRNERSDVSYFNWAIVTYKNDILDSEKFNPGVSNDGVVGQTVVGFFRDQGTAANSRATGMDDLKTGMELHCLPINTDLYKILRHKRYKLGSNQTGKPGGANNNGSTGSNMIMINRWIPLKRQVRYSAADALTCQQPIFLIMWCSTHLEAGGTVPIECVSRQLRAITYFRNMQN